MYKKLLLLVFFFSTSYAQIYTTMDSLKDAITKNPDDPIHHFKLARIYYDLEMYDFALEEFKYVLELDSENASAMNRIAMVYQIMDSLEQALNILEDLKIIYAKDRKARDLLCAVYGRCGTIHAELGEHEIALKNYHDGMAHCLHSIDLSIKLAMIYQYLGDTLKANKWHAKAIEALAAQELEKDWFLYYKSLFSYRLGKFDEATSVAQQIKDLIFLREFNCGLFRLVSGDTKGIADIREACALDPYGCFELIYFALLAIKNDDLANAKYCLEKTLDITKDVRIAHGLLAWTLEQMEWQNEAKRCWFECYGKLPLCIDVESMRTFMDEFIATLKENNQESDDQ